MTDTRIEGRTVTPGRLTADGSIRARGTRDGALLSADWFQALVLEGRVFAANVGTGTTPTTFNATFAAAEQDLFVHVPSGTTIMPLYLSVAFEDTGTAQVMDVVAVASAVSDAAVTGTAITVVNMRTNAPYTTNCTATAVITAAGTTPYTGNYVEFWRPYAGFADDAFNTSVPWRIGEFHGVEWSVKTGGIAPVIQGAGSLSVYASAQAGIGFIVAIWAEIPTTGA